MISIGLPPEILIESGEITRGVQLPKFYPFAVSHFDQIESINISKIPSRVKKSVDKNGTKLLKTKNVRGTLNII